MDVKVDAVIGVSAPVWFAQDGNTLYVRTVDGSGKVKRIRNNPHVRVMPCGVRGQPMGEWVENQAHFAGADESKRQTTMTKLKWILASVVVILVLAVGGFVIWGNTPLPPMPEAFAALQSDPQVKVEAGGWYVFRPVASEPATGFALYQGGRVDPRAYAPTARAIAAQGYLVVIVPMPLNLAIFGIEKASDVIAAFPSIKRWVIGGHSLGGSMAASYAHRHPRAVQGLALWASYPADSDSLASSSLMVASIYGTHDGLVDKLERSGTLLPAGTVWVPIEGGNHAQFGWYGLQPGDGQAAISRAAQQSQIVSATVQLLKETQARRNAE